MTRIVLIIVVVLLFFVGLLYFWIKDEKANLEYNFRGKVENLRYDVKGTPYVTISGNEYYLSSDWNFDYQIEKGDSLVKKKGEMIVTLIKQTGKKIVFK